jgi:hypothetical protein
MAFSAGELANGDYLIGGGVVVAVCGLLLLTGPAKAKGVRILLNLGAVLGGAFLLAVEYAAYHHVNDLIALMGSSQVTMGTALYAGVAAAVVAIVGGLMGLVSRG